MHRSDVIVRSGKPSKHDQWAYGTVCQSKKVHSNKFEVYVQMSHDDRFPQWEKVGTFNPDTLSPVME